MDYQQEYRNKLTTPEEAVKCIKSGDWVDYGVSAIHPKALDRALAARSEELFDVKIRGMNALWLPEIAKVPDAPKHFTWHSWAMMGVNGRCRKWGCAIIFPCAIPNCPVCTEKILHPAQWPCFR